MRWLLLLLGVLLLAGCGGGGIPPPPPIVYRPDLLFGYFDSAASVAAFANHCNLGWVADWEAWQPAVTLQRVKDCVANGITKVIIGGRYMCFSGTAYVGTVACQGYFRAVFDLLKTNGLLPNVVAVYVMDEPDFAGISEVDLAQACRDIRMVFAGYPELAACKLAVIYGAPGTNTPAVSSFDWIGFDNYAADIFTDGSYDAFRANKVAVNQRVILVPGGANPFRQLPDAYMAKAQSDPAVLLVAPFLWIDPPGATPPYGIGDNGLAHAYCVAGQQVTRPGLPPTCA